MKPEDRVKVIKVDSLSQKSSDIKYKYLSFNEVYIIESVNKFSVILRDVSPDTGYLYKSWSREQFVVVNSKFIKRVKCI